jgi:hypothetical protein
MSERHDNSNPTTRPTGSSTILPWLIGGLAVVGGVILASSGILSHLMGRARRGRSVPASENSADAASRSAILRRQQDGTYSALFEEGNGSSPSSWTVRGHIEGNTFRPETVETSPAGNNRFPAPPSLRVPIRRDGDTMYIGREDMRGIDVSALGTGAVPQDQPLPQQGAPATPPAAELLTPSPPQRNLPPPPGQSPPIALSSSDASLPESAPVTPLAATLAIARKPGTRDPQG